MTDSLEFIHDRCGFPMVWVEPLQGHVHWQPVTKIQFEYFLCSASDSRLDDGWYDKLLRLNPRVSPSGISKRNYWKALLTGILPEEGQRFARWCGEDYEIPTLDDWFTAYQHLRELEVQTIDWRAALPALSDRCHKLLERLERAGEAVAEERGAPRTLADQMLMRMGAMEWVELPGERHQWGGMGQPNRSFQGVLFKPDQGQPMLPKAPESERLAYFGFRLLKRDN